MKKLVLVLALIGGFSVSSKAYVVPGTNCGSKKVGGILTICCRGNGNCFAVIIKKFTDVDGFVVTTYNNGNINLVEGTYNCSEVSSPYQNADGSTTTTATLLP